MAKTRAVAASSGKGGGRKNQEERDARKARRKAAEAEARAAAEAAEAKARLEQAERDEDEVEDEDEEARDSDRRSGDGEAELGDASKPKPATATAPTPDHPAIDERITQYAKVGVPLVILGTTAVVGITLGTAPALLVLAGGALVAVIATFWASVRTLLGETPLGGADAYALGAPRAEEEQKRAVLRALKDLEFERSVGKISDDDYAALVAKYRAEAKRLLRALDTDAAPARRQIEVLVAKRLRDEGLATSETVAEAEEAARESGAAKSGKREKLNVRDVVGSVVNARRFDDAVQKMAAESAEEEAEAEAEIQRELEAERASARSEGQARGAQRSERSERASRAEDEAENDDDLDDDVDAPAAKMPAQAKVPSDIAAAREADEDAVFPTPTITASTTPLPRNGSDNPVRTSTMPPRIGSLRPAPLRRRSGAPDAGESKPCAECGTTNDVDAVFCKKCGTRRVAAARDDA